MRGSSDTYDVLVVGGGAAGLVRHGRRTSVPGVCAAGNAVNPRAQVITAAGEGAAAAIALDNDLVEADVRDAVALFRLGMPPQGRPRPPAGRAGTDPHILEESS